MRPAAYLLDTTFRKWGGGGKIKLPLYQEFLGEVEEEGHIAQTWLGQVPPIKLTGVSETEHPPMGGLPYMGTKPPLG